MNEQTFYCVKPTNLKIMLMVAYPGFILFEKKIKFELSPHVENRKKSMKKNTGEKITLLHNLKE